MKCHHEVEKENLEMDVDRKVWEDDIEVEEIKLVAEMEKVNFFFKFFTILSARKLYDYF